MNKILLVSALLFAGIAAADDAPAKHGDESYAVGMLGSGTMTDGDKHGFTLLGARAGFSPFRAQTGALVSFGIYVGTSTDSATLSGVSISTRGTLVTPELLARKLFNTGLYAGLKAGIILTSASVTSASYSGSASSTRFTWGSSIGYEQPVASGFDLVLDVGFQSTASGSLTLPGLSSIPIESSSFFAYSGGIAFHW